MKQLTLLARAKINLTLDVLGKREDGYHEVSMIMQSLELADCVHLRDADTISLETDSRQLPADETNLAYRAAVLLQRQYRVQRGVHICLEKKIPLAAGLAGGSADAAAVLRGLSWLWELNLTPRELCGLGAVLGSDVPFCLYGGTALATGRGELVAELPNLPPRAVVLAKPPIGVATAHVYSQYRSETVRIHPDTEAVLAAVRRSDWQGIESSLVNVLESVTITENPQLAAMKELMLAAGATGSLMSGSGPTVFCLTENETIAIDIAQRVKQNFQAEVIVTKTAQRQSGGGE